MVEWGAGSPLSQTWLISRSTPKSSPYRATASFSTSSSDGPSRSSSRLPAPSCAGPSRMSLAAPAAVQTIGVDDHGVDFLTNFESVAVGNHCDGVRVRDRAEEVRT